MTGDELEAGYRAAAHLRVRLLSFQRRTEEITAKHGLTPQRYLLLLLVGAAEAAPTVTSLCGPLQMSQSSVTHLVQGATRAGLVESAKDVRDNRRSYLSLTPLGEARLAAAFHDLGPERTSLFDALGGAA